MAHKKHHGPGPIPPGNQSHAGPPGADTNLQEDPKSGGGAPAQEQDPKRRLGDYQTEGEHAIQQPGGKNGPNQ